MSDVRAEPRPAPTPPEFADDDLFHWYDPRTPEVTWCGLDATGIPETERHEPMCPICDAIDRMYDGGWS